MRQIFIIIIFCFVSCFQSQAQKLNGFGEKMVKELTLSNDGGLYVHFVYDYDVENKVKSLTVFKGDNELYEKYYKENGKIKYKGYHKTNDCLTYDIKTDEDGKIISVEVVVFDIYNKPYQKNEYKFEYIWDNGRYRFDKSTATYYGYHYKRNEFVADDFKDERQIIEENRLYKRKDNWSIETDFEHINDTNVSFYGIINSNVTTDTHIDYLFLTDWLNIKGDYFPKYIDRVSDYWNIVYRYDDKRNIIQITRMRKDIIDIQVDIKYVE